MNINHQPLVFIHIPKTAGTSFRMALDKKIGEKKNCKDYGVDNVVTSPCVVACYQSRDFFEFYEKFGQAGYCALSGHFQAQKYVNIFSAQSMVTFLRNPVKRVLSEYSHFCRLFDYQGTLEDFYTSKRNINFQSKYLNNVPRQLIGLVGISERYEESLALFAHRFGLKLPIGWENTDPNKVANSIALTVEQNKQIEAYNEEDISLYQKAVKEFDVQIEMMHAKKPYTFADFHITETKRLNGWAFQRDNVTPVTLKFILNGDEYRTVVAKGYRANLHRFGCPRKGYVGFSLELAALGKDDVLQCLVVETGQLFDIDMQGVGV